MNQDTKELKNQYKEKTQVLKNFIEKNSNLAKQGSKQWLAEKQFTIGGSEMAVITGHSAFSNIRNLVAQKVGITKFNGNAATRWGNLFEGVSEKTFVHLFLNKYKSHKIYSTGSIPHWGVENHKYSPDGLCLMNFPNQYKISLLEFKSPHRSVPDHKVPRHYLPQIKSGLCTIEIAENAIFVNNMFKKCGLNQLDFTLSHDELYHKNSKPYLKNIDQALCHGIILFSMSVEDIEEFFNIKKESNIQETVKETVKEKDNVAYYKEFANDSDSEDNIEIHQEELDKNANIMTKITTLINLIKSGEKNVDVLYNYFIDLGSEDTENFEKFLEVYKPENQESIIDVRYLNPQINKNYLVNLIVPEDLSYVKSRSYLNDRIKKYNYTTTIKDFIKRCINNNKIPLAVLPWKLFRSSNILVEKESNYVMNYKEDINRTINIIKKISEIEDLNSRAEAFEQYFPDSDIVKEYFLTNTKSPEYYKEFVS